MHPNRTTQRLLAAVTLSFCFLHPVAAQRSRACAGNTTTLSPIVNLRIDNDMLGGHGQDQGYTSGVYLSFVSPDLRDHADDPCLSPIAQWTNQHFGTWGTKPLDQLNMIASVSQQIYTPNDFSRSDLIQDDRPYAAMLLFSFGYNARQGNELRTTQLQVGVVGPAAMGRQAQNDVHRLIGAQTFRGWNHQLNDEAVFRLIHERMHRFSTSSGAQGWGWDTIGHYGGSLGNLATYLNAGAEFRVGINLPEDFGSTPLRPAGENTAPTRESRTQYTPGAHLFLTFDARWVLHDITLDGNSFRNSHGVDKRNAVATVGYGLAIMRNRWKFALARYYGTREFDTQQENPIFGSFTVSRAF